jgi:hypothetical protein
MRTTPAYNYVNRTRDNQKCGGGVVIRIYKYLIFRHQSHLIPANLNKKLEMVFVQVVHEQFEVYAINAYAIRKKKKYFRPV